MTYHNYLDDSRVEVLCESGMFFSILMLLAEGTAWLFWAFALSSALCYAGAITILLLLATGKTQYKDNKRPSIIIYWQTLVTCVILLFRLHERSKIILCILAIVIMSIVLAYSLLKRLK